MQYEQTFIVNGKFLGTAGRGRIMQQRPEGIEPLGYVFLCCVCGEIWARCPVTDTFTGKTTHYQSLSKRCKKHEQEFSLHPPGSLYLSYDAEFVHSWPDEVVRYEFHLAMKYYFGEEE